MSSQPTIKDVAKLAGVSIGTVDRVLHDRGHVSDINKEAVLQAVESLQYQPSQIARALSKRRQKIKIGVSYPFVEHDFWTDASNGIKEKATQLLKFGIEIIAEPFYSYDSDAQVQSIKRLIAQGVHAIAMTPMNDICNYIDKIIPSSVHFCTVIDDCVSERKLFHVGPNDFAMGSTMAKLAILYRNSNLKIAVIAPNSNQKGTGERISGFRTKLIEEGYKNALVQVYNVEGQTEKMSYDNIYDKVMEIIQNNPEVNVIYITNGLTQWAAAAVNIANKKNEIYVFGHEYTKLTCEYVKKDYIMASIYQKPAHQWRVALQLLSDFLIGDNSAPPQNINTECLIITKETLPLLEIN